MPHASTRARRPARDTGPKRTHDDCQWLDEKDGKQNVLGYGSDGYRGGRAPRVAEYQSNHRNWENDAGSEDGV